MTLYDVLAENICQVHLSVQIVAGNDLTTNHSHLWPADLLVTNWDTAAFAVLAAEEKKHGGQ